jgi:hypothetical protein
MLVKHRLLSLAVLPLGMIILCSCAAPSDEVTGNPAVINQGAATASGPSPETVSTHKPVVSQEPIVSNKNDVSLLKSSLKQSLSSLIASVEYPSEKQIKDATKMAASDHQEIEISPVGTPTGLRADSIEVAFAIDSKECLFGYIRGKDVSTSILPALSNGKCMIGATP